MIFEEIIYKDDKKLLDFNNGNIVLRNAVRAIIIDKNNILMVFLEKQKNINFPVVEWKIMRQLKKL
jgi:hypothetical protein